MSLSPQSTRQPLAKREQFSPDATITLTVYMRTFTPDSDGRGSLSTLEDLQAAEAAGVVSDLSVETWPPRVERTGADSDEPALDTYEAFREWAESEGVSITPPFTECSMPASDERGEVDVVTLPKLCLAVYEDGELACVYPHHEGANTRTVADSLEALSAVGRRTDSP